MIELFINFCPLLGIGTVEKYLPYSFLHFSHMDIASGRQRTIDPLVRPEFNITDSDDAKEGNDEEKEEEYDGKTEDVEEE
jgi:hypothetical protein